MELEMVYWFFGVLGLYLVIRHLIGYVLFKRSAKKEEDPFSDILTNEKYMVKGQWEK